MIARVFAAKTAFCPVDKHAYFDTPDMFTPKDYREVHISCTFTWDIDKAYSLAEAWRDHGKKVIVGGVAIDGESDQPFKAGMYLREGITITSRGCVNNCSFCMVRRGLIEFDDFPIGNQIMDNNILACSDQHWRKVLKMLSTQNQIEFKGGLEAARITPKVAEELRSLRIKQLWLACDTEGAIEPLRKAVELLKNVGFKRDHLHCYALIGREEIRLREIYDIGCLPFAQLYQPPQKNKIIYSKNAKAWQRAWCRPAAYRTFLKEEREI